jgi:sortase (surface protein transpeptidase)
VQRVDVSQVVPAGASAVVVNLTATESNGSGFWTAFVPGGPVPTASNVNTDQPGQTRANQAILPLVGDRAINVFASSGGHLVVDVAGYFTGATAGASTDGLFVPATPSRALDTRERPDYGRMYPGWVCEFDFAGRSQAQAAVINLTTTETRGAGFFTTYAARTDRPLASNLNATTSNQTIANHAIARASTAGIAVFTQSGGVVIVDVAGYFTGAPVAARYPPVQNVVPPPSPLPYRIQIPALGNVATIVEGVGDNVVDAGYVGHWPGTSLAGQDGHMVLFAHRTEHGGMWRYLHTLGPGAQVIITGADGRTYTYQYVDRTITGTDSTQIFNAGLGSPQPSLSLVACSKTNYLPTDTRFRMVVNFTEI